MTSLSFTHQHATNFIKQDDFHLLHEKVTNLHYQLHEQTGLGGDFLGWIDYPATYDEIEFSRIERAAKKIQQDSDILLVIGIGGSYLGAKAAIEMLNHSFNNLLQKKARGTPQIIFVGHHLSSTYICELFDLLEDKEFSINVISKSGTTTEPAIAFRIFKNFLEKKYGKIEGRKRIYVTTDKEKGALKVLAKAENYVTFVIPDNIGGRYSVLTAVGLLPIAVSGVDIAHIMNGAKAAMHDLNDPDLNNNSAYQYAVTRNILYNQGKTIEILVNYDTRLQYFGEWWKQLFGESEGKNNRGIFPASANYTTDLHSLGQYIQDGERNFFQTILFVNQPKRDLKLDIDESNFDNLNYLSGKTIHEINKHAYEGALVAHTSGNVPNLIISVQHLDAYTFGYIVYFFLKACALSSYLLGVNPFDQPGVEAYKNNMFTLLNKPGYEQASKKLQQQINSTKNILL